MSLLKKRGIVVAEYVKQNIPEYDNNIYISSMGEIATPNQVVETMEFIPEVLDEERSLDKESKLKKLNKIDYYHCTVGVDILGEASISDIMREGYRYRYGCEVNDVDSEEYQYRNRYVARALGIFAKSGCGKTTLIDKIQLMNYEGIIHLPDEKDITSNYVVQIPIVKVNIPANCSPKNVCTRILEEVDRVSEGLEKYRRTEQTHNEFAKKKDYNSKYRFPNVDALFRYTKAVIRNNAVGVIILDEIHNIRYLNKKEHNTILNFFVELSNELKVPLVFVGTEEAIPLFMEKFQNGRRLCTETPIMFGGIDWGIEWEVFLHNLFTLQWIEKPLALDDKISKFLYQMAHGIPDVVIKVFKETQKIAIKSGIEHMDEELFIRAYRELCPLLDDELIDMDNKADIDIKYRLNLNNKKKRVSKIVSSSMRVQSNGNEKHIPIINSEITDNPDEIQESSNIIIDSKGLLDVYNKIPKENRKQKYRIYEALKDSGFIANELEFVE